MTDLQLELPIDTDTDLEPDSFHDWILAVREDNLADREQDNE